MQKNIVKKSLVFVVIALFIGIAVQPGISTNTIPKEEKTNVEPKDYLFQTIIDIANNPDVQHFFKGLEKDWKKNQGYITINYDKRSLIQELLKKKPRLFFSLLSTRPTITYEYLNKAYEQGCELIEIFGEEKMSAIMKSVNFTKPEVFNELKNLIMNNEDLNEKIQMLSEMNQESSSGSNICDILFIIEFSLIFILVAFEKIFETLFGRLGVILFIPIAAVLVPLIKLAFYIDSDVIGCWWPPPPHG